MSDDLERLVRTELPKLAYQIMSPVRHIPPSIFQKAGKIKYGGKKYTRDNRVKPQWTDWSKADRDKALVYAGGEKINGQNAYFYRGHKSNGAVNKDWYVAFFGIRLVELESVEPQPVDINPGDKQLVEVKSQVNNGPGIEKMVITRTESSEKNKEFSFKELLETEFETSMTRSAKAGIEGIGEASAEWTTRFKLLASFEANQAWSESEAIEEGLENEYVLFPYCSLDLLREKGEPDIRQVTRTTGKLECGVRVHIDQADQQTFDSLDRVEKIWAGLETGVRFYSDWFVPNPVSRSDRAAWNRPKLILDLETRGKRVRYGKTTKNYKPIAGYEREFERGRRAYYQQIGG